MEEICGKMTARGKRCVTPKSKCSYHQVLRRKFYPPVLHVNFLTRTICGVKTTGHSQGGMPCQKSLKNDEEFCVYHAGILFDSKSVSVAYTLASMGMI